ncbi:MAG TPA: FeoB-associated Cys-rich membrane protein [Synergistaceae bacterium]|nr:FeoB-associated Cys-rich membrane protein [Synergistaceae bacterium]
MGNPATIVVGVIVTLIVSAALYSLLRKKGRGSGSCCGGCVGCGGCGGARPYDKEKR